MDFLAPEQKLRYGRFSGEPSAEQLARYFYLDDTDREIILGKRGNHNRPGFAIQLGTVRSLGLFLSDPCDVPPGVIKMMAGQLHVRILPASISTVPRNPAGTTLPRSGSATAILISRINPSTFG